MSVARRLAEIRAAIAAASARAGRDPSAVRVLAATKTQPPEVVAEAIHAGVDAVGENRVQEAAAKKPRVGAAAAWHLVGPLQRNKAASALALFDVIQTLDRTALADTLERLLAEQQRHLKVFLEVNVGGEEQKAGVTAPDLPILAEHVLRHCPHLQLGGLMTIPPYDPEPELSRPHFKALRGHADALCERFGLPPLELSMGMSEDYTVAVEEGATWVRLGRTLLGDRA